MSSDRVGEAPGPSSHSPSSATAEAVAPQPRDAARNADLLGVLWWTLRLLVALFVFVGALQVMKEGATGFEALSRGGSLLTHNALSTLGLGWIGALFVLSGSPVAASALTLVAAGSVTELQGFTMLTGSRLGASFVVLLVAVIYALRGGQGRRMAPVSTAVIALSTTALVYIPGAAIAYGLLKWPPFRGLEVVLPTQFGDFIDLVFGGILERIGGWSAPVLFLGGLGLLLVAFKLLDTVVPDLDDHDIEESRLGWLRSKWPMFALGCLVALIAMSVSVALTVLVPLVAKRYVKREHIMPYIMGANITTLGDTLMAAFLLQSAEAVRIVLAGIIGVTVTSVFVLAFFYPQVRSGVWKFQRQMVKSKPRLAGFTAGLFLVPLSMILIGGWLR